MEMIQMGKDQRNHGRIDWDRHGVKLFCIHCMGREVGPLESGL